MRRVKNRKKILNKLFLAELRALKPELTASAVIRKLEIIGEAAKGIPYTGVVAGEKIGHGPFSLFPIKEMPHDNR